MKYEHVIMKQYVKKWYFIFLRLWCSRSNSSVGKLSADNFIDCQFELYIRMVIILPCPNSFISFYTSHQNDNSKGDVLMNQLEVIYIGHCRMNNTEQSEFKHYLPLEQLTQEKTQISNRRQKKKNPTIFK